MFSSLRFMDASDILLRTGMWMPFVAGRWVVNRAWLTVRISWLLWAGCFDIAGYY